MAAGWSSPTATNRLLTDSQTTTASLYYDDNYSTTTTYGYGNVSSGNVAVLEFREQNETERLFEKGKFFKFESSMEFRAWFGKPKAPKKAVKARHGFQQAARIPCYRGVRTR